MTDEIAFTTNISHAIAKEKVLQTDKQRAVGHGQTSRELQAHLYNLYL